MAIQTLSALAVRITGIFLGLSFLRSIGNFLTSFGKAIQDPWLFMALTPTVMMFGAALCMVFFPRIIAAKFVPVVPNESKDPPAIGQLELLGSALLGLYFLVQVVLNVTGMISFYFAGLQWNTPFLWSPQYVSSLAVIIVQFIVAMWLLNGAQGLFRLVRWARSAHAD